MLWIILAFLILAFVLVIGGLSLISIIEQIHYWNTQDKIMFLHSFNPNLKQELSQIVNNYCHSTEQMNLIELGCGRAGILRFLNSKHEWKTAIGVEGQFVIWLQAWLLSWGQKIQIIRGNLFEFEFSKPALIYCYLSKVMINKLFEQNKFSGCVVICLDYEIESKKPIQMIEFKSDRKIQNKLFVYDFR
jgi:16S rRNA A1518/A1519 N6-dimethyltransferase RsmA/KsgA/DIM1 with predicted DNA glycosylase/AP lyase activity